MWTLYRAGGEGIGSVLTELIALLELSHKSHFYHNECFGVSRKNVNSSVLVTEFRAGRTEMKYQVKYRVYFPPHPFC